jgi:plasmid stability protein
MSGEKRGFLVVAVSAGSAYAGCMQYTIRNLPALLDEAIRKRAKEEGKSLNTVAVEALMEAFGLRGSAPTRRDVSDLAGTWVDDAAVDEALQAQRGVDDEMWR